MVVDIRSERVPQNLILMLDDTNVVPSGYSHSCCFDGRFIKGVPCCSTNPGTQSGAITHLHAAACHTHTVCGTNPHTHTVSLTQAFPRSGTTGGAGVPVSTAGHAWPPGASTNTAPMTICCCPSPDHTAANQEPAFIETKFIIKSNALDLRTNNIPIQGIGLWTASNCCIPIDQIIDTNYFSAYPKGTLNACTGPGTCGGGTTHQHTSGGCHIHAGQVSCHTHSINPGTSGPASPGPTDSSPGSGAAPGAHTHSKGTLCMGNTCGTPFCTGTSGCHQHPAGCNDPLHRNSTFIKHSIIDIRSRPVNTCTVYLWVCTLACVPSGFNDCCAFYTRYPKGITAACVCPGPTAGSATHTHGCTGTHVHSAGPSPHNHPITGNTSAAASTAISGPQSFQRGGHLHGVTCGGASNVATVLGGGCSSCAGGHTHGTGVNDVSNITVAYIKKTL